MTLFARSCVAAAAVCLLAPSFAVDTVTPHFDEGEKKELEKGDIYKEETAASRKKKAAKRREAEMKKQAVAVAEHIKTLNSSKSDETEKGTAAEYLGALNAYEAIPDLIECLRPGRHEKDSVVRLANGSLVKMTQKNFGSTNYEAWNNWWIANKKKFLEEKHNEVPETDKITAESENTQGLELMKIGEYRNAYNHFVVSIDKNPVIPDYRNNAGIALMQMGRILDAMVYFDECIGLNPDLPQPYMNIGRCYSRMDKSIEAQAWFAKAKERDKNGVLWDIFWMIGKEYLKRGEYKLAFEYLDQARSKAEKRRIRDPRVYNDLAICHYCLDQYHSAWKEICNMKFLGFEANPDFVKKVRKVLKDNGTDPDEEDRLAREHFASLMKGDEGDDTARAKERPASVLDSMKLK